MHGKYLYEYAVVRVVPKVEREEFLNVGIIVFCKRQKFLRMTFKLNLSRLSAFATELEPEQLEENLQSFDKICQGAPDGGPISLEETAERFRWLTAVKSSCIQTSRPHPGFSNDLEMTLERLFEELVL